MENLDEIVTEIWTRMCWGNNAECHGPLCETLEGNLLLHVRFDEVSCFMHDSSSTALTFRLLASLFAVISLQLTR